MSIKKDLTPGQICQVANNLVEDNALDYFLENRPVIFETWTSLPSMMAAASVDESVVAAFNLVHSLSRIKDRKRLNLRFAYLQLNNAIRTLDATAEVAYTDAYLHSKTKLLEISSRQLNKYVQRGQRWFTLAGPSPLLLSVYSKLAETIVFNNSITFANLQALTEMVQAMYPKLVHDLITFDDIIKTTYIRSEES